MMSSAVPTDAGESTAAAAGHHHQGQAHRDIERVTDYAEEAEVDSSKLSKAMDFLSDVGGNKSAGPAAEKITIARDDVEAIMREMQVGKATAEKALRQAKGNLLVALRQLIESPSYL